MDLQNVRTLAHKVYCQCNEPSSPFRSLSRCVRALRNKLEDADESLGDSTFRPEVIRMLEAAAEGRDVLSRLDRALQQFRYGMTSEEDSEESIVVDFATHIAMVTHRLQSALDDLERLSVDVDQVLASVRYPSVRSPSYRSGREHCEQASTATPSVRSSSPSYSTVSEQLSATSGAVTTPGSERWPGGYKMAFSLDRRSSTDHRSSSSKPKGQMAPIRFADPMSSAIEEASSIILRNDHERHFIEQTLPELKAVCGNSDSGHSKVVAQEAMQARRSQNLLSEELRTVAAPDELAPAERRNERPWGAPSDVAERSKRLVTRQSDDLNRHSRQEGSYRSAALSGVTVAEAWQRRASMMNLSAVSPGPGTNITYAQSFAAPPPCAVQPVPHPRAMSQAITAETTLESGIIAHTSTRSAAQDMRPPFFSTEEEAQQSSVESEPPKAGASQSSRYQYRIVNPDSSDPLAPTYQRIDAGNQSRHEREAGPRELPIRSNAVPKAMLQTESMPPTLTYSAADQVSEILHRPLEPAIEAANTEGHVNSDGREKTFRQTPDDAGKIVVEPPPAERFHLLLRYWNECLWHQAGAEIRCLLTSYIECNDRPMVRRMHHLLGIVSSLQGRWVEALSSFLAVLSSPVTESSQIDAGDCAAAYWLGDTYSLLNRRAEALLAYAIAERGPMFQESGPRGRQLLRCIRAEQEACQVGGIESSLKLQWDREAQTVDRSSADSILNLSYVTASTAGMFVSRLSQQRTRDVEKPLPLEPNQSRAMVFINLSGESGSWLGKHRLQLSQSAFESSGPWPIAFDPCFAMGNVSRNRLLVHECDLLKVCTSSLAGKLPKLGPIDRSRKDCFSCQDLQWAIVTIRACLIRLKMDWCEMANVAGACFVVRYSHTTEEVATTHFLTIALYRLSFRPGYGVDVGSDGLCSARIMRSESVFDKGVHREETKRVRTLIRRHLDAAAKRQEAIDLKDTALPVMGMNGGMYRRAPDKDKAVRPVASPSSSRSGSVFSRMS